MRLLNPKEKSDDIHIFESDYELSYLYVSNNNLHDYEKSDLNICVSNINNEIISMMSILKKSKNTYEIMVL